MASIRPLSDQKLEFAGKRAEYDARSPSDGPFGRGNPPPTSAENNSSVVSLFVTDEGDRFLFTADAGTPALMGALDYLEANGSHPSVFTHVQVPHHGSRHNVNPALLDRLLGPRLFVSQVLRQAFVSVGNSPGPKHPSKRVLNAFNRRGAPVTHQAGGSTIRFSRNAPDRGWVRVPPQPFYEIVQESEPEAA